MKNLSKIALASILSIAIVISGCSTSWIQTAENDAPVVLQIVVSILSIADVAAIPAAQSVGAQAQSDLKLLSQYLADYKAAQAGTTEQNKALANIQAALQASQTDLSGILAAIHVVDPTKQKAIEGGLAVALSVLLAVESLIPQPAPAPASAKAAKSAPKLLKPAEVKKTYNAVIGVAYPHAVIK